MKSITVLYLGLLPLFSYSQSDTLFYQDGQVKVIIEQKHFGVFKTHFYPSGNISAKLSYQDGLLSGLQEYFHPNGQLSASENWTADLQEDSSSYFYPNGALEKKGLFIPFIVKN